MAQQTDISKMETTQTAVEWLFETMAKTPMINWYEIREQAKAMEKEQIVNAHGKKINGGFRTNGDFFQEEITGEQYYKDTYNK